MGHIRELAVAIGPRPAGSPEEQRTIQYLQRIFGAAGYQTTLEQFKRFDGGVSPNVIARFPNVDYSNGYVVVGGHYDTVANSAGANDNASGTAVVLALAQAFTGRKLSLEFVGFGAEEYPPSRAGNLAGSKSYAAGLGDPKIVQAMISLDMVVAGPAVLIVMAQGTPGELQNELGEVAASLGIPHRLTARGSFSDHVPFAQRGIPAAWLWSGNHPSLHKPSDVFEIVQPAAVERTGRLTLEWLLRRMLL